MRIEVSGHKFNFPHKCACCGTIPDATLSATATRSRGKRVVHTDSKSWDFPYCSSCTSHVQASKSASSALTAVITISIFLALLVGWNSTASIGWFVAIAGIILAIVMYQNLKAKAKSICTPTCATIDAGVRYRGWHGTRHIFEIASSGYSTEFIIANQSKLVNVPPDLWRWLQSNGDVAGPNQPQSARRNMT